MVIQQGHVSLNIPNVTNNTSGLLIRRCIQKLFSYFSIKTLVVGTQKNHLIEMVLLSTQNTCLYWWIRKYLQFWCLVEQDPSYQITSLIIDMNRLKNVSCLNLILLNQNISSFAIHICYQNSHYSIQQMVLWLINRTV